MDFTIQLSDDERLTGGLSGENRRLATHLLMCNGFVLLRGALCAVAPFV